MADSDTDRDRERFRRRLYESVSGFNPPPPSRWERNHAIVASRRWITHLFLERRMSTATPEFSLEHFEPELTGYQPSAWLALRWALRRLRPGPSDVLVDFGCGKGRVVCEAALRPFGRVVGVDISSALVEVAKVNVDRNRRRFKCHNVELITANAAEWSVPDDMTIGYLFHPFAGATFDRVLENIVGSIRRRPRRVRLVYVSPLLEQKILDTGDFRVIARRRGRGRSGRFVNSVSVLDHDPVHSVSTSPAAGNPTMSHKLDPFDEGRRG